MRHKTQAFGKMVHNNSTSCHFSPGKRRLFTPFHPFLNDILHPYIKSYTRKCQSAKYFSVPGVGNVGFFQKLFLGKRAKHLGMFYKLDYLFLAILVSCLATFQPLACIFLSFKHLHSPLCACSQDRNLLCDSSKIVSTDDKPSAIKLVWMAEVRRREVYQANL